MNNKKRLDKLLNVFSFRPQQGLTIMNRIGKDENNKVISFRPQQGLTIMNKQQGQTIKDYIKL